jgi:hypothetical protein
MDTTTSTILHPTYYYTKANSPSIERPNVQPETQLPESTFNSMECLPGSRICHIQTYSLRSICKGHLGGGSKGREGKGRGISSKATSSIGEWVLSTTPSQEAPIEITRVSFRHLLCFI